MKCNAINVVMGLFIVVMFGLTGCGGGGSAATPAPSLITSVGLYFDNIAPDYTNNVTTCSLNITVYYSDSIAPADIESFSMTAANGWVWTIPSQNFQSGTSSSGKPYVRAGIYYGGNSYAFPLAGIWTARINLKNGQTSSLQITLHEPGSSAAATHQYLYSAEDWTPSTNQSQYIAALSRFPTQGYTVQYSAANGGKITTTGLAAVRAGFLASEPRAYNMFCWLYDVNNVYLGNTTRVYSTLDHSSTNLITFDGELSLTPAATTSPTGAVDLSLVKYIRFVYIDGAQYVPSSYSNLDERSISPLVAVNVAELFSPSVRYPGPASISDFSFGDTANEGVLVLPQR
jgi:hypothetical protein